MRCPCLIVVLGGSAGLIGAGAEPEARTAAARTAPFAAILSDVYGGPTRIGCVHPLSLRLTSASSVIGEYHGAWSASPDGSRVALGLSAAGKTARIGVRIVNVVDWTTELDVETGIAAEGVGWLTERRLVAALLRGGIVLIDPVTGALLRRWAGWTVLDSPMARTRRRFVMLEPGPRASRLAVVDAAGRLRSLTLRFPRRPAAHGSSQALVTDPVREHAYVVGDRTLLDVDLRRMRVRRLRLHPGRASFERQGRVEFSDRQAVWLGRTRLALSGRDVVTDRRGRSRTFPAGVRTIDTDTGKLRAIDSQAEGVTRARQRLLAFGARGLRGYTLAGRRVFHVLDDKGIWNVETTRGRAYVSASRAVYLLDARSGRVQRRIPRPLALRAVMPGRCER